MAKILFSRPMSSNGDGTGTVDWSGNYSVTPGYAKLSPAPGEVFHVTTLIVHVADNGAFTLDGFGSGAALTNGITVYSEDGTGNTTEYVNIKANDDFFHYVPGSSFSRERWAGNVDSIVFSLPTSLFGVSSFTLLHGDSLVVSFEDDLSGMEHIYCRCLGYTEV